MCLVLRYWKWHFVKHFPFIWWHFGAGFLCRWANAIDVALSQIAEMSHWALLENIYHVRVVSTLQWVKKTLFARFYWLDGSNACFIAIFCCADFWCNECIIERKEDIYYLTLYFIKERSFKLYWRWVSINEYDILQYTTIKGFLPGKYLPYSMLINFTLMLHGL